jgi:hypothetical protein
MTEIESKQPMCAFYRHDLGWFTSRRDDLSDLGEPYLTAAKEYAAYRAAKRAKFAQNNTAE